MFTSISKKTTYVKKKYSESFLILFPEAVEGEQPESLRRILHWFSNEIMALSKFQKVILVVTFTIYLQIC